MSSTARPRGLVAAALAAALLAAVAGCGTTVQGAAPDATAGGTTGLGTGGTSTSSSSTDGGATGGSTGSLTPQGGSSGNGTGGATGATGATSGAPGSTVGGSTTGTSAVTSAPGVTATQIRVGIMYTVNGDQAAKSLGYNLSRGDENKNWQAVIAEVNARGGVAGRKLVPVYFPYDGTQSAATQEQAECAAFTQDKKVFVVLTTGSPDFTACLDRAGVLHATTGSYVGHDRDFYRRFPTFLEQRPSQDRYQADLVAALVRQKYFGGWDTVNGAPGTGAAKLGVVVGDRSDYTRPLEQVMLPALRRAGHPVDPTLVFRVPLYTGAPDAAPIAAATKNAVLRFQQSGVTHVVILDANGTITAVFAQNAQSQLYFPRLAGTSASGFQQLYDLGALNAKQINGATGLGWTPTLDLAAGQGDKYLSKAAPECLSVIKRRTGQTFSSTTAAGVATLACDAVFPLATALKHLSGPLTRLSAVRALESFPGTLLAASIPRLSFSPTRHDGLLTGFDMVWDTRCTCIRYADAGHRMP
jgi:hypothetical protein